MFPPQLRLYDYLDLLHRLRNFKMHFIANSYYLTLCTPTKCPFRDGMGFKFIHFGTTLANCKVKISLLIFCKLCTCIFPFN